MGLKFENTNPELKRCPFCGGFATYCNRYTPRFGGAFMIFIKCKLCNAQSTVFSVRGDTDDFEKTHFINQMSEKTRIAFDKAIKSWNQRAYCDHVFDEHDCFPGEWSETR